MFLKMICYSHLKILFSKTRPEVFPRLEILKTMFQRIILGRTKRLCFLDLSKNGQFWADLTDISKEI